MPPACWRYWTRHCAREDGQHPPPAGPLALRARRPVRAGPESLPDRLCPVVTAVRAGGASRRRSAVGGNNPAALVGVDPDHVRLLGRRGEIVGVRARLRRGGSALAEHAGRVMPRPQPRRDALLRLALALAEAPPSPDAGPARGVGGSQGQPVPLPRLREAGWQIEAMHDDAASAR